MAQKVDALRLTKTLGRHTRLSIPFSWTVGGNPVNLAAGNYVVRVWVQEAGGAIAAGPFDTTVDGTVATYLMRAEDLVTASEDSQTPAKVVAVAENGEQTLVSDAREIIVGDWGGADNYTPTVSGA